MCNCIPHLSRALADTRQTGKLSKEQFALAMYFIQQKVSKGIDPPQVLSPDMVPPSERGTPIPVSSQASLFLFFPPPTRRWCWCPRAPVLSLPGHVWGWELGVGVLGLGHLDCSQVSGQWPVASGLVPDM